MRAGDWFGATVNVAARVSSIAEAGSWLLRERKPLPDACAASTYIRSVSTA
jgi:class 3 adenylate cyclase